MSFRRFKCKKCGRELWDLADLIYHECPSGERDGGQGIGTQAGQTPQTEVERCE